MCCLININYNCVPYLGGDHKQHQIIKIVYGSKHAIGNINVIPQLSTSDMSCPLGW